MRGGKPSLYFYSKFCTGTKVNWMGETDLTCDGEEDMKRSVAAIKASLEDYKPLRHLQLLYMDRYEVLENGLEVATYSNGTRLVGNFSSVAQTYGAHTVEPYDYLMLV
jgi:hypothetical protein